MEDANGVKQKTYKYKCVEMGCSVPLRFGEHKFCPEHQGTCKADGCRGGKVARDGYCRKHRERVLTGRAVTPFGKRERKYVEDCERAYETVRRLKRKADLRGRHIDGLLSKQGGKCARSIVTCEVVQNGYATPVCPWGERTLPRDAADVDHTLPLADGGTDDEDNLQVLCKCCHGIKTAIETQERKYRRIREEAMAAAK